MKPSLFGNLLSGGSTKYDDAAELYTKAANLYKVAKKYDQAGAAFVKAAHAYLEAKSKHEAASSYINAANCVKKNNTTEAGNHYRTAIELFTDDGRFSIAAKHQKELAELYEADNDYEQAIEAYKKAADWYEGENSTSAANGCLLKMAQFYAELEQYDEAVKIYEEVAQKSLENNLTKWSAKDYFFRAILCYLCQQDRVTAQRQLEVYQEMDYSFGSQRECKFCQEIINAYENVDVEAFTAAVVEFDSISKLDKWKTTILLRIKKSMTESPSLS